MKKSPIALTVLLCISALYSCSTDDSPLLPDEQWTVSAVNYLDETESDEPQALSWQSSFESVRVRIQGSRQNLRAIVVSSDCDWLSVESDTLASDSIVAFSTLSNISGQRRTATLTFSDIDNPSRSAQLKLTQLSESDGDTNGEDARMQLYVGYGYDIYKALESPMAVRTSQPILDIEALWGQNIASNYDVIQDCHLSRTDTRYVASNNIHAYGKDLTEQQTDDSKNVILGCRENCITAESLIEPGKGTLEQQNLGHGSLEKAVASRVIDRAALLDLQRRGRMPFTDDYLHNIWLARNTSGTRRRQVIEQILTTYGTHVIIQADLGGRIDYTFTMQKATSFNSVQEMQDEISYTLGRITDKERKTLGVRPSSSKSRHGAITVRGGSEQTRTVLENDIKDLNETGQLNPAHITDWLASINWSKEPARDPSLDVIHFELMPVWDLVPDDLRSDFRDVTLSLVQRSDCQLPASFLGTDIYEIAPKSTIYRSLFDFTRNLTPNIGSLCRLLYFETEPVLEVCTEYVPKIRTDARITVAYPIYKQHIRLNEGLFIGDGIHQPAIVGFSGADCYVYPIDSLPPGKVIEKFWYVNGNLMLNNPTRVNNLTGKQRVIQEDYMPLYTDNVNGSIKHRHPIIKLGSKFWTRRDTNHRMLFAERTNEPGTDWMEGNVCYGWFQYEPNSEFNAYNDWIWGYSPNTYFDSKPNTKWYLPMPDDVRDLYQYIGFNTKALFKDQISGWDAQFNGYYGQSNILNRNNYFSGGQRDLRYKDELNIISSKSTNAYADACILVLKPDYTMQLIDNQTYRNANWRLNFYPVRSVRGYMFTYPTTTDINKNFSIRGGKYE